jgi:hypothetical protein
LRDSNPRPPDYKIDDSELIKCKLREGASALDPLQLLEEIRAMQSYLVVLADGGKMDVPNPPEQSLSAFLASLSSARREEEIRPTHRLESEPRYLRRIQSVVRRDTITARQTDPPRPPKAVPAPERPVVTENRPAAPRLNPEIERQCDLQRQEFARRYIRRQHAFTLIWSVHGAGCCKGKRAP